MRIKIGRCSGNVPHYCQPFALYVRESSDTVFLSTVVMRNIRRLSLLRMYGDHLRMKCVRAAHTTRMHDAVGVCIAPLLRTFCVWFARRSHGDFFNRFKILWCTFGETTAHTKFLGACGVSIVYLQVFRTPCERSSIAGQWDRSIMYRLGQKFLDIFLRRLLHPLMLYQNLS